MTVARITQLFAEVVLNADAAARITQLAAEVVLAEDVEFRCSLMAVEVLTDVVASTTSENKPQMNVIASA